MVLQPCFAITAGAASEASNLIPLQSNLEALENRFAALDVEELAESDGEAAATHPTPPPRSQVIYEVEASKEKEDLEREKLFAIFCLFNDLGYLRSYVSNIWANTRRRRSTSSLHQ